MALADLWLAGKDFEGMTIAYFVPGLTKTTRNLRMAVDSTELTIGQPYGRNSFQIYAIHVILNLRIRLQMPCQIEGFFECSL